MFENNRELLFKRSIDFKSIWDVDNEFRKGFAELVEELIIEMIDGEDNFFGQFLIKTKREIRLDISWPIGTVPKDTSYIMNFNPVLFLKYTKREMIALIKHEIYHIMYGHYERARELRNKYNSISVNLALDISINQYIKNLPMDSYRLDRVCREFDINLNEDESCEVYAEKIDKVIRENVKIDNKDISNSEIEDRISIDKAHDIWNEIKEGNEQINDIMKKNAISSANGKIPLEFLKILNGLGGKAEISWQGLLRKLLPHLISNSKKTITRRNRRQPDRFDLRGTLSDNIPKLIVAIDISASMSDNDFEKILIEVLEITKSRFKEILLIECDNMIKRIYKIRSKKDIKKRMDKTGATRFTPVFEYINKQKLDRDGLIYFTDGVGEKELGVVPKIKNIIWVLIGDEEFSLKNTYGVVKRIGNNNNLGKGKDYAINLVKENIHDWAR